MPKLLRVVHKDGRGLYESFLCHELHVQRDEEIPVYQPTIQEEGINLEQKKWRGWKCAFSSGMQFMSWFRDIDPLDIYCIGGKVIEVEVPTEFCRIVRSQAVYDGTKVINQRDIGFEELIELISPYERLYRGY